MSDVKCYCCEKQLDIIDLKDWQHYYKNFNKYFKAEGFLCDECLKSNVNFENYNKFLSAIKGNCDVEEGKWISFDLSVEDIKYMLFNIYSFNDFHNEILQDNSKKQIKDFKTSDEFVKYYCNEFLELCKKNEEFKYHNIYKVYKSCQYNYKSRNNLLDLFNSYNSSSLEYEFLKIYFKDLLNITAEYEYKKDCDNAKWLSMDFCNVEQVSIFDEKIDEKIDDKYIVRKISHRKHRNCLNGKLM